MKIKEFIEKVNEHDGMRAKMSRDCVVVGSKGRPIIYWIPKDATNWIEIDTWATSNILYWQKPDREYLSALIEEFLHTPVKERFPEKEYYLVANRDSLKRYGTNDLKYVNCICNGSDKFSFEYGEPAKFSERELDNIKKLCPSIAPAIDAMKEETKDDD